MPPLLLEMKFIENTTLQHSFPKSMQSLNCNIRQQYKNANVQYKDLLYYVKVIYRY